jgi:MFS family permease
MLDHNLALRENMLDREEMQSEFEEGFTEEIKKKTLYAIIVVILIGNMMVSNLSAFLPLFVAKNDWTISEDGSDTSLTDNEISYILASFSVAQVIFSPFNSLIKNWLGTKNTIVIGLFLVMISTGGLGAIAVIKNGD